MALRRSDSGTLRSMASFLTSRWGMRGSRWSEIAGRRLRVLHQRRRDRQFAHPRPVHRDRAQHVLGDVGHARERLDLGLGQLRAAQHRGGDHPVRVPDEHGALLARSLHRQLEALRHGHRLQHGVITFSGSASTATSSPVSTSGASVSSVATFAGTMPRAAKNASTFSLVSWRAIRPATASTGSARWSGWRRWRRASRRW